MTDRELLEQAHDALYKEDRISGYNNHGKLRKDLRERLAQRLKARLRSYAPILGYRTVLLRLFRFTPPHNSANGKG